MDKVLIVLGVLVVIAYLFVHFGGLSLILDHKYESSSEDYEYDDYQEIKDNIEEAMEYIYSAQCYFTGEFPETKSEAESDLNNAWDILQRIDKR